MQTVASLAERLDMTPEEALEKLRFMLFDVDGPDVEITDEQCDLLIDIDDDPDVATRIRDTRLKEQEKQRKRVERLQKAAKKAAATRKAKKKKAEEKGEAEEAAAPKEQEAVTETVTKRARAERKTVRAETAEETAPSGKETAPPPKETAEEAPATESVVEPVAEAAPSEDVAAKPFAEILPAEEPAEAETVGTPDVAAAEPELQVEPPELEEVREVEAADKKAKKTRKREKKEKPRVPDLVIGGAAASEEEVVQVIRADGRLVDLESEELATAAPPATEVEEEEETGILAEAERRQEEEELRRARAVARPLPKPDPQVVEEVKRRAAERSAARTRSERTVVEPSRKSTKPTGKTARKRQKKIEKLRAEEALRRDAAAAVREYEAGTMAGQKRRKRRRARSDEEGLVDEETRPRRIEVDESIALEELADLMEMDVNDLILALMDHNVMANKNQLIPIDLVRRLAEPMGLEVEAAIPGEEEALAEKPDTPEDQKPRAPVVTVMGHVDHGKTTLLDWVRKANVAAGEAGGITQHIAAYDVTLPEGRVVFLDTPGHEAFTQMRARGAEVTDVVVLVVAADDGVMPQTIEAIDHAKAADVPIIVAINKCDKPDAQPERIRQELMRFDLVDEKWGGKTIIKNISAKMGQGVDELMELLALETELLELKANPNKRARGTVLESEISRGQGPVSWVLIQSGTLRVGDSFLAGQAYGRVRAMIRPQGEMVEEAGPSTPVLVMGFDGLPDAGDPFAVVADERVARIIAEKRATMAKQKQGAAARHVTLEDFHERLLAGEKHVLHVVLKADVQGSVDVLRSSLTKLGNQEVGVDIVHAGVGGINESDVMLASATDAVVIGFHVTANARVQKTAEQEGVDIHTYRVIYEAIDEVRKALEGMLTPETKEVVTGHAEIREVFRSSALGNIAGCYVQDGEIDRNALVRVIRDDIVTAETRISSLRRGKDDIRNVSSSYECGIKLDNFEDIKAGDILEAYHFEDIAKTLA
jgi:translation initiation factor IF-2